MKIPKRNFLHRKLSETIFLCSEIKTTRFHPLTKVSGLISDIIKMTKDKEKRVFMKPGKTNKEDRLNFIEFWANYIRTHSDEEWSKQQNVLIDSVIKSARAVKKKEKGN